MTTATKTPPNHNTLTCYTDYGCRLPACNERARTYEKRRRAGLAAGTWQPLIDATPVRQHLLELHAAGVTVFRVATLTGLSDAAVRGFTQQKKNGGRLIGRRHRTTPEIAARILAINPAQATPAKVGSTGSTRRLQALVAIGWPLAEIARRSRISYSTLSYVSPQRLILASTAAAITATYEKYKNLPPTRATVTDRQLKMARARAASHRWPTPSYWDATGAIDDPGFEHAYKVTRTQVIAEEARWLLDGGLADRDTIADRLGVSRFYLDRSLREHPQDAQAAA